MQCSMAASWRREGRPRRCLRLRWCPLCSCKRPQAVRGQVGDQEPLAKLDHDVDDRAVREGRVQAHLQPVLGQHLLRGWPQEANGYLLGGATPASKQTTQYLLRNEILKQLDDVVDELQYQLKQPVDQRDDSVAREYLQNVLKYFGEYLALAPKEQLEIAMTATAK